MRGRQLVDIAIRKYDREGLLGLLSSAGRTATRRTFNPVREAQARLILRRLDSRIIDRDDLPQYATTCREFGQHEVIEIRFPDTESLPPELEAMVGSYRIERPFVCEVDGVNLVWDNAIAVADGRKPILESIEASRDIFRDRIIRRLRQHGFATTVRELSGMAAPQYHLSDPIFPLVSHPTTNYYHWMLGYLGKVRALEFYRQETAVEPKVMIASDRPSWMTQSLDLVGISPGDCFEWDGTSTSVDRVIVPRHLHRYGEFTPSRDECRYLQQRMSGNVRDVDPPNTPRIFISREQARTRRVENRAETEALLEDYGFVLYQLEDLSVAEQVALFSQAEVIVAPHGAGLVNMIFADDPTIIEILPQNDIRDHFFCLARQLNYDYKYLISKPHGTDMVVDILKLERRLTTSLSGIDKSG